MNKHFTVPLEIISYYINTSEILGELSRVNMISSHVKITCYFTLDIELNTRR